MKFALSVLALAATVHADVYMHNPRGSNDRNCEKNVNRNNGNRLFDSQNNAKGGYACGRAVGGNDVVTKPMAFHAGSQLPVEWTQQHGCGKHPEKPGEGENVNCQIVIQYACEDTLDPAQAYRGNLNNLVGNRYQNAAAAPRDGIPNNANDAATDRIPQNANSAQVTNTNALRYGMHETLAYYQTCDRRQRNEGLFTADQNVNRNSAIGTRQNPNGGRRGLECPEERDYYPYWHPTPWRDVAFMVTDMKDCDKLKQAQGAVQHGYCELPTKNNGVEITNQGLTGAAAAAYNNRQWPNNEQACKNLGQTWKSTLYHPDGDQAKYQAEAKANEPKCEQAAYGRSNQLGNAISTTEQQPGYAPDGQDKPDAKSTPNRFLWTIPDTPNKNCVLRLRYNMSSFEADQDPDGAGPKQFLDSGDNGNNSPIRQDPYVTIGNNNKEFLALNVNTNQYGRTFQDRSYVFEIKPKAPGYGGPNEPKLFNLNVRGKRGNIVQTYPSVEYDFIPNDLQLGEGDGVHFQWTGSDYNPARGCNDGTGGPPDGNANNNARADRMNLIEQAQPQANMPKGMMNNAAYVQNSMFANGEAAKRMAFLGQENLPVCQNGNQQNCCKTQAQLNAINAGNARDNNPQNCAFVNQGGETAQNNRGQTKYTPYFDGGVQKMGTQGRHTYYSSRNNNFSNRDSKGFIQVIPDQTKMPTRQPSRQPTQKPTTSPTAIPPVTPKSPDGPWSPPTEDEVDQKIREIDADNSGAKGKQDIVENDALSDGVATGCDRIPKAWSSAGASAAPAFVSVFVGIVIGFFNM
eukprot:CAMPEP_0175103978 /NCGR_PEP_ID=MMETSP0086_2-20121207/9431_1 /TAXON_ID=136419 /ORGANISM="Unknown Unknown, Strain D1" /LENGTH=797 /DNA_ID=CAMNT_0016379237 /DNA_START=62 /DNA_END=2455 /DNA_ORIENTATION=-